VTCCVESFIVDPPKYPVHKELSSTAGCRIKFCAWLVRNMCSYNYYILFHYASYRQAQLWTPSTPQAILLISNRNNKIMSFVGNFRPHTLSNSDAISSKPGVMCLFVSSITNSTQMALTQAVVVLLCVFLFA